MAIEIFDKCPECGGLQFLEKLTKAQCAVLALEMLKFADPEARVECTIKMEDTSNA